MINIDAHFDTRAEQQSTSGTSFRQILEEDDNTDYLVLGISQGVIRKVYLIMLKRKD